MILKHIAAPPGTGLGPRSVCSGASHTVACSPTRQVSPVPPPRRLGPAAAAPAGSPRSLGPRRQAWLSSHRAGQPKCEGISHEYVPRVTRSQHRANPVPPVKKNCSEPAADSADSADGAGGAFHSRARHGGRPGGAGGPEAAVCKTEKNRSAPHAELDPQARNNEVGTVTPPEQAYCPGPCWSHSRASEWGGGREGACEKQMPATPQSTGLSGSAGVRGPGTLHF